MQRPMPLVFAVSIVAACGGKAVSGADFSGGDAESVRKACAAQASANCALRDTCSGAVANQITYGSTALCVSRLTAGCVANMASPETANSVAHVEGCARAYPGETCVDWWDANTVAACRSVAGPRSSGAPCGVNSQCASAFCAVGINAECGVCAPAPMAGTPCQTSPDCQYDLTCPIVAPATSGVCTRRVTAAGACDALNPCVGGLACIGANSKKNAMGMCQTAATLVGAPCDYQTGPGCDSTLYLSCVSATCQKENLAPPGQPCGNFGVAGTVRCTASAVCLGKGGTTCVAPAADGAACDSALGPPCLAPAKCITAPGGTVGRCIFPNPARCG